MHFFGLILLIFATSANAETPDGYHPNLKQVWNVDCNGDNATCVDECNRVELNELPLCLKLCQSNLLTCQKSQAN